ncbi:hypothetical protein SDRG_14136 [Saprolegnia diclina VS20]|uniref:Uncharacterized protein n=1 Tax=Saprolegnia diclina (strain VS20) TaxID=1156394 RepID=T0Q3Q6_SAPDV|nr:hypothetical protein SDRG_14136 [Saprolegnia diclina VS20]EQC28040.1 hypothetical protein SDRG_14136 [Saprolegnia diclina VS20]|eukprot:XP_008618465.1 hypothetical protein SDRG_14136 [Saprolegnia diclina VS20]
MWRIMPCRLGGYFWPSQDGGASEHQGRPRHCTTHDGRTYMLVSFLLLWYSHLLGWYHWLLARTWTSLDDQHDDACAVDLEAEGTAIGDAPTAHADAPRTIPLQASDAVRSDNQADDAPLPTTDSLDAVLHMIDGYINWLAAPPRELAEIDDGNNNNQIDGEDVKDKEEAELTPEVDTEFNMTTTTLARTKAPAKLVRGKSASKVVHLASVVPAKGAKRLPKVAADSDTRPRFVTVSRKRSYFSTA